MPRNQKPEYGNQIFWLLVTGIWLLVTSAYAQDVPKHTGWVNDFADVIDAEWEEKLTNLIIELEQKTSAEIAVVTIQSIAPYDENQYARALFDKWRVGKKGKDNGAVVLLVMKERRWKIDTGYGLEGILPDGLCGEIGRKYMVPYFKEGKFGEGLCNGTAQLAKIISKNSEVELQGLKGIDLERLKGVERTPWSVFFFIPIFFFFWNLPWPVYIGLPFTLLFAAVFVSFSPVLAFLVIFGYLVSLFTRFMYLKRLPARKRPNFWGAQTYGGTFSSSGSGGGGGFGGGFGGFGGGGGGGGGAGGGW